MMKNGLGRVTSKSENKKNILKLKSLSAHERNHCEHEDSTHTKKHPDHTSALARLRKVKGQIIGLEKMIEEGRYCVDILVQFRAIVAGLSAIEANVFERHLRRCVQEAFNSRDRIEINVKVEELMKLISKRLY